MAQSKTKNEKFIYEVSVTGPKHLAPEYLAWLKPHVKDMLSTGCFFESRVFNGEVLNSESAELVFHVVIHYCLETKELFELYLTDFAPKMRNQLPADWKTKLTFQRKLLTISDRF